MNNEENRSVYVLTKYVKYQVCLAPDYVLVQEKVKDQLIEKMQSLLPKMFGPNKDTMPRLVNEQHFDRVKRMLDEKHGGKVVEGGLDRADRRTKYLPPTLVVDPSSNSLMMSEEIFGPILPIIAVPNMDRALEIIHGKENPLGAYVFTQTDSIAQTFLMEVPSGGGCVNDVFSHVRNKNLPFGGSGKSGIGAYGGKYSFDTFSHKQAVVEFHPSKDEGRLYPPFSPKMVGILKSLL